MSLPYTRPATFAIPPATLRRLVDEVFARTARRPAVLLAIEDEALRDAARRALVRALFTVVEPHEGAVSPESVRTHLPDVVLADVRTPEGREAVGRLRELPELRGVPVVGLGRPPRVAARRLEVECLVPVPFDAGGLVERVERVTGG